jgi:DNA replication protein DnaC
MPCPLCNDTFWRSIEDEGVERVVRCECWRRQFAEAALKNAGIPPGYQHCTLSNFKGDYDSINRARRKALAFVDAFPVVDRGLLFYGLHGVGKTHLAVAILREAILQKGARGYFFETAKLLKQIRDTYNSETVQTEMDVLRPVLDADLLVLDDVGFGKTSEWVHETLGLVVDQRYSQRRPLIITTNFEDLNDNTDPNSLVFKLGIRTRSRLREMCDFLKIENADIREVGPEASAAQINEWFKTSPGSPKNLPSGLKGSVPTKASAMARARLRPRPDVDLKWTGGKAGS